MNSVEVRQADQKVGNKGKNNGILTEETSTEHDIGKQKLTFVSY